MTNSIDNAQKLFDCEQYKAALEMSMDLIRNNINRKEAFIIATKSFLHRMDSPMHDEDNATFINSYKSACLLAETGEELRIIENEMAVEYQKWKARTITEHFRILERKPTINLLKDIYNTIPKYLEIPIFMILTENECINSFCERKGISREKFSQEYPSLAGPTEFSDDDISTLEYYTAQKIFNNANSKLTANADGNPEYIEMISKKILMELFTAERVAANSYSNDNCTGNIRLERLKLHAEILSFTMNAMIYPNGVPISLFLGDREDYHKQLKSIYYEIQQLDETFVIPTLPNIKGVRPQSEQPRSTVANSTSVPHSKQVANNLDQLPTGFLYFLAAINPLVGMIFCLFIKQTNPQKANTMTWVAVLSSIIGLIFIISYFSSQYA